jgi:tripartite-type tricarboxylate transporter receptor subunit TctC
MIMSVLRPAMRVAPIVALMLWMEAANAQSVEDFYAGKTITLSIGFTPGGGYDLYGRLVARHLGKHIPGRPNIVVQNMPGAGSMRAVQHLNSIAPKDGTALATFGRQMGIAPLLNPAAQYDGRRLTWLGSVTNEVTTCVSWHTSRIKTFSDTLTNQITLGGDGPGADPDVFALLYKNVFDMQVRLVSGYHGTAPIILAMQRGEVDGLCGYSWSTIRSKHRDWLRDRTINLLIQAALEKEPELAQVPFALDLAKTDEQRQILRLFLSSQEMARPFAAPPDIPADRKAALITAFERMLTDPEFIAETKKLDLDVHPLRARQIDDLLRDVYSTPKPILEKAAQAVAR